MSKIRKKCSFYEEKKFGWIDSGMKRGSISITFLVIFYLILVTLYHGLKLFPNEANASNTLIQVKFKMPVWSPLFMF